MEVTKFIRTGLFWVALAMSALHAYTQEQYEGNFAVLEELDVMLPMRDGVRLATNIYRPGSSGAFPVLLMRSPYGNGGAGNSDAHYFVRQGYVVVTQDTRGQGGSEGVFDAFQTEAADGYDTQQWIGKQAWCNGKIGTYGGSYVGFTQWITAPLQSPYLVTMVPAVTFSDLHEVAYQSGAFYLQLFTPWSIEMTRPDLISREEVSQRMDSVLMTLPLLEQDRAMGWKIPFLRDWLLHPEHDPYWDRTSVPDYSSIRTSAYNVGGWYDILLEGTIDNYLEMTGPEVDPEISKKQKLLIGPWVHSMGRRQVGELDFGEEAVFDSRSFRLRWFDSQLKDIKNGVLEEAPVRIFVMGKNYWRYENEWPLARTDYRKFYFNSRGGANTRHGDGVLSAEPPESAGTDQYNYDPEDPVPTIGTMGPYDQRPVEERSDVLVYTSAVLENDLELTGPVQAVIYASSTAVNTDFTAKLVDVYPDGRAIRICEGIIRADHRNPEAPPSNIEPGKIYEYTIELWATSNVFLKGHRMRVEISSSNFPRFDRNLNTGLNFASDTTWTTAQQTLYHGPDYPSCIILPVIFSE